MAVFELVGRGSCGERQKMIAETDAEYRLAGAHRGLDMPYRRNALSRISGAVGEKKGIIFIGGEVVIPRHADEGHIPPHERAHDIFFHPAVDGYYFYRAVPVRLFLFRTHAGDKILFVGVLEQHVRPTRSNMFDSA